jgi:hypothetical protein
MQSAIAGEKLQFNTLYKACNNSRVNDICSLVLSSQQEFKRIADENLSEEVKTTSSFMLNLYLKKDFQINHFFFNSDSIHVQLDHISYKLTFDF